MVRAIICAIAVWSIICVGIGMCIADRYGCEHEWGDGIEVRLWDEVNDRMPVGYRKVYICKKCKKKKVVKL